MSRTYARHGITSSDLETEARLPPGFLDGECTKDDILIIYGCLVYSRVLANHLKLPGPKISAVETDAYSAEDRPLMLLQKWKEVYSFKATYRVLINALIAAEKVDTAREVCRKLKDAKYPGGYQGPQHMQAGYNTPATGYQRPSHHVTGSSTQMQAGYDINSGVHMQMGYNIPGRQTAAMNMGTSEQILNLPSLQPQQGRRGERVVVDDDSKKEVQDDGNSFTNFLSKINPLARRSDRSPQPPSDRSPQPPSDRSPQPPSDRSPQPPSERSPQPPNLPVGEDDDDSNCSYTMASNPRGLGIVINNKKFDPASHMKDRDGTDIDAAKLVSLFTYLGFDATCYNDQTADQMKAIMQGLAEIYDSANPKYDCLMVAILTHGSDGGILWGVDGHEVSVRTLTKCIDGHRCKALIDKPKILILQACRGGRADHSVMSDGHLQADSFPPSQDNQTYEDDYKKALPNECGFLLAFSSTPGYKSYRYPDAGSDFIKVFVDKVTKLAPQKHLVDILTRVNRKLAEDHTYDRCKQMASYETRLTKDLYFFPPQGK